MMNRTGFLLLLTGWMVMLSLYSCKKNIETRSFEHKFDLVNLIDSQVVYLSANHYGVRKISSLGDKKDTVENYPDSSGWAKELNILKTVDVSKPGIRPYYKFKSYEEASCLVESYILTDTGKLNTIYQKVFRDKTSKKLAKIVAEQIIDNPIYHSGRYIEIIFKQDDADNLVIDSLKVKGYQKMIFQDTAFYNSIAKTIR